MSQLRPLKIPDEIQRDVFRAGELSLFEFARTLPGDWYVLYSVPWYLPKGAKGASESPEGEADFVIVGPEIGVVVIEVKGGRVGRDAEGWYSIDRKDIKHPIKDPYAQSAKAKHTILRNLKQTPKFRTRFISAVHMVCFPLVYSRDVPRLPEGPLEATITREDLDASRFADKLRIAAAAAKYPGSSPLTNDECRAIADFLKPEFELPARWGSIVRAQRAYIDALTDEQDRILRALGNSQRTGLVGPAGSGKTIIGLRWARDQIALGKRVLAILPHTKLSQCYEGLLDQLGNSPLFKHELHGANPLNCDSYSWKPDCVLVEEAQDLKLEWWVEIDRFHEESGASLLALYDANQRLRKKEDTYFPDDLLELRLSRVIRNARPIATFASRFFRHGDIRCEIVGPDGSAIVEIPSEPQRAGFEIAKYVRHLVVNEGFDFRDIVVLIPERRKHTEIELGKDYGGISFKGLGNWWGNANKIGIIPMMPVTQFRGMESPVVILAGLDGALERDRVEACYVGVSRATYLLALCATPETLGRIKNGDN